MTNRFLISVAAVALIAGTGFANAQGTGTSRDGGAAGGATVQQGATSSERGAPSAAPMDRGAGESKGMKSTQSEPKSPAGGKNLRAEDGMQGQKSKGASSEMNDSKGGKDMKAEDRSGSRMNNAQSKEGISKDGMKDAQSRDGRTGNTADSKSGSTKVEGQTTGNAATSATAAPPAEKRAQIVSAIRSEKIQETTNVNFNISVGARVPSSVRFHPLPPRIVEIYPEWRGYEVILVSGRYVIVRPQTHEIVYIIES